MSKAILFSSSLFVLLSAINQVAYVLSKDKDNKFHFLLYSIYWLVFAIFVAVMALAFEVIL